MIIYPPLIKESAPAFLYHNVDSTTSEITVPFEWNPAVPKGAGITLKLLIKEYFTSTIIVSGIDTATAGSAAAIFNVEDTTYKIDNVTYTFPLIGLYYKLQIAYDDGTSQELVYSSVALGRCISSNIDLQITDIEETLTDQETVMENCVDYKGIYLRDLLNEPLYSYLFDFKDLFGNILESSGEVIWDNELDKTINPEPLLDDLDAYILYWLSSPMQSIDTSFSLKIDLYDDDHYKPGSKKLDTININFGVINGSGLYVSNNIYIPQGSYYFLGEDSWGNFIKHDTILEITQNYCGYFNTNFILKDNGYWTLSSSYTPVNMFKSTPTYHLKYEPQIGQTYTMDFTITTINGYSTTTSRTITKLLEESPIYSLPFITKENHDDGYIELGFASLSNTNVGDLHRVEGSDSFPTKLQILYSNGHIDEFTLNNNDEAWISNQQTTKEFTFTIPNFVGPIYAALSIYLPYTYTRNFNLVSPWLWPGQHKITFTNYFGYRDDSQNGRPYWSADSIIITRSSSLTNINGKFSLERKEMNNSNTIWERITEIHIGETGNLSDWTWRDFSVKLDTEYRYRCRQFNNGHYSIANYGQIMCLRSEDIFLSDSNKQLKIRFNPKVSSMKETILETKTDTIGSKYPIFYRNGQVRYREIPISGLISYLMDDNQFFMNDEELGLSTESQLREATTAADSQMKVRTTSLIDYNIYAERVFREEVLQWLNNGKPKLFRSPTEGNFVVRLMNVSLSPNETVGRMLWTFSATAYEMADTEFETLKKYNLINIQELIPEGTNFISKMWKYGDDMDEAILNVKNIVWSSLIPVTNSYITLEDQDGNKTTFYNYIGLFETPKDVVYKSMTINEVIKTVDGIDINDLTRSTINYEVSGTTYDPDNDNFGTTKVLIGKWETISDGTYTNVYYLSLSRTTEKVLDSSVIINDQTIDLSDGQVRYYYDLGTVKIGTITNATGTIYYGGTS